MSKIKKARRKFIKQLRKGFRGSRQQLNRDIRSIKRGDIDDAVMEKYNEAMHHKNAENNRICR